MSTQVTDGAMIKALEDAHHAAALPDRDPESLPTEIAAAVSDLFDHGTETTQLVAMTNIASVVADPTLKASYLQAQAGGIDLRSCYKRTTRPFLVQLAAMKGVKWQPSADPYVSNPYREERVDEQWVAARGGRLPGASKLFTIVRYVDEHPEQSTAVLEFVVEELLRKMDARLIDYRIPPRLTVPVVLTLFQKWLNNGVGGNRLEILTVSFFRSVGVGLGSIWTKVTSHHVNDPVSFDALCMQGAAVKAVVEVKDTPLTNDFLEKLVDQAVEMSCQRCFLVTRDQHLIGGLEPFESLCSEYAALGVRVQVLTIENAMRSWLAILDTDDDAIPRFVRTVRDELEERGTLEERTDLAMALRQLIAKPH